MKNIFMKQMTHVCGGLKKFVDLKMVWKKSKHWRYFLGKTLFYHTCYLFLIMQSFFELQLGNYHASYKCLSKVIEYAISSLPSSSILMRECLERIELILRGLGVDWTEIVSRDYTEGEA